MCPGILDSPQFSNKIKSLAAWSEECCQAASWACLQSRSGTDRVPGGVAVDGGDKLANEATDEAGEPIIFYGSEATMVINGNTLTVTPQDTSARPEGYSLNGWTAAAKQQYLDQWHEAHPAAAAKLGEVESYSAPQGYNDTADHIANFFHAIGTREHVQEDEVFGNNAAIACHMANHSYFHKGVATWDAGTKTIKG